MKQLYVSKAPLKCWWPGCKISNSLFENEQSLYHHIKIDHIFSSTGPITCPWMPQQVTGETRGEQVCGIEFRNKHHMVDHLASHFSHSFKPFQCEFCPSQFRHRQGLRRHQVQEHSDKLHLKVKYKRTMSRITTRHSNSQDLGKTSMDAPSPSPSTESPSSPSRSLNYLYPSIAPRDLGYQDGPRRMTTRRSSAPSYTSVFIQSPSYKQEYRAPSPDISARRRHEPESWERSPPLVRYTSPTLNGSIRASVYDAPMFPCVNTRIPYSPFSSPAVSPTRANVTLVDHPSATHGRISPLIVTLNQYSLSSQGSMTHGMNGNSGSLAVPFSLSQGIDRGKSKSRCTSTSQSPPKNTENQPTMNPFSLDAIMNRK